MSTLASEAFGISATGNITSSSTTLVPTVTRVESRIDVNPVSVILAVSTVFILAPITISSNTMILAAFYRYKRLRTASNCLLASLAVSDFGVGVFMPFGMHLELSGFPDNVEASTVCITPYCIVIALCSVSVLVTVAIAVDRLTSLAQPLRYKNIITHSSVEKYIAVFWLYSIGVGLSPLIYAHIMGITKSHSGSCRFGTAVRPPVQLFLLIAVWAPSALVLLGCYMYVYLVARAHARAIYTVELSFRHQTQTMALPRYGQTLAVTVGAFLILWLPFQACMLLDIICGTNILSEWTVVWLGLLILAHSAANPWIYAFHHGEMRVAATKIAEDVVTRFGIHPSRYGCSPTRRGSNTNYELAEVNKSNETRQPPVEDCFAAKHLTILYQREKTKCQPAGEFVSSDTDISPEGVEPRGRFSGDSFSAAIVEEDIHDLTNMLKPEYVIDRNNLIDSNHNVDKIKHWKYLLDPTFSKIRNLKCLNHKLACAKTLSRSDEPRFISYQNLKTDEDSNRKVGQFSAMSDPTLHAEDVDGEPRGGLGERSRDDASLYRQRNSNLASMSDPNFEATHGNIVRTEFTKVCGSRDYALDDDYDCSIRSLQHEKSPRPALLCRRIDKLRKSMNPPCGTVGWRNLESDETFRDPKTRLGCFNLTETPGARNGGSKRFNAQIKLTTNKLADIGNANPHRSTQPGLISSATNNEVRSTRELSKLSGSISTIERSNHGRLPYSYGFVDGLAVPTVHSEPPSPMEPLPIGSPAERKPLGMFSHPRKNAAASPTTRSPRDANLAPAKRENHEISVQSPSAISNLTIPYVLFNFEGTNDKENIGRNVEPKFAEPRTFNETNERTFHAQGCPGVPEPEELAAAILLSAEKTRERRPSGTIFNEHDSTRFSSRRPSDLRWSESSRSQEVLSNVNGPRISPSSYSVNNFQSCASGSDLNDVTCLGSFVCPDALTSSLRESFFELPSIQNSDAFASLEDLENPNSSPLVVDDDKLSSPIIPMSHHSISSANLERTRTNLNDCCDDSDQSESSESVLKKRHRAILRLEASVHRSRPRVRPGQDCIIREATFKRTPRLAPLALPTPMEICTPTYDTTAEIKGSTGVGVRV